MEKEEEKSYAGRKKKRINPDELTCPRLMNPKTFMKGNLQYRCFHIQSGQKRGRVSKEVTWCFTPSQLIWLCQCKKGEREGRRERGWELNLENLNFTLQGL